MAFICAIVDAASGIGQKKKIKERVVDTCFQFFLYFLLLSSRRR